MLWVLIRRASCFCGEIRKILPDTFPYLDLCLIWHYSLLRSVSEFFSYIVNIADTYFQSQSNYQNSSGRQTFVVDAH